MAMQVSVQQVDVSNVTGVYAARWSGQDMVRFAVAAILVVAAALKGYQLSTEPALSRTLLESRWFLVSVVECELLLAIWLLSSIRIRVAWGISTVCFATFAAVSLIKGVKGEASCGCFGRVPVNPWITFALDAVVVTALLAWWPGPQTVRKGSSRARRWRHAWIGSGVLVCTAALLPMLAYRHTALDAAGIIVGSGNLVVLEPENWVGSQFPLLPFIERADSLRTGEHIVVLYHHDCPKCNEALDVYERLAAELTRRGSSQRVAILEISSGAAAPIPPSSHCDWKQLDDSYEWFVQTPVVLQLENGRVIGVEERSRSEG
jgi:hypothetical protein